MFPISRKSYPKKSFRPAGDLLLTFTFTNFKVSGKVLLYFSNFLKRIRHTQLTEHNSENWKQIAKAVTEKSLFSRIPLWKHSNFLPG